MGSGKQKLPSAIYLSFYLAYCSESTHLMHLVADAEKNTSVGGTTTQDNSRQCRAKWWWLLVFSDGFFFSVPGTCFENIGKQVLFPYVSVPVPCFRKDSPPPYFLPFFTVTIKNKSSAKTKNACSWFHGTPRATRGWTMSLNKWE